MKSFDTDLKKQADKIKLKVAERKELRERVLSYMEYHPLPKQESVGKVVQEGIVSEPFIQLHFSGFQLRMAGGVLVLLLILMPVIAERSVPGDVLYALKTNVNEKIQASLANSPYEKIEFETKLMERRISEARILASEGKLTEEAKEQIEETVKEHAQAVQAGLTELRTQDADSAAIAEIEFNSSLEVQSTVLAADEEEGEMLLDGIITVVNEARDETVQNQEENKPSYVGLVARVEKQTTRAYELFETVKETATQEEIVDIERRLSDINRIFEEAKEKNLTDEPIAIAELTDVLGMIQKLIAFMTDIDLREVVALEELVPVVFSDEERTDLAKEEIRIIDGIKADVTSRLESLEEEGVLEKVTEGLTAIDEYLNNARGTLELPDIGATEGILSEARALVDDLNSMTSPQEPIEEAVVPEEETVLPEEENLEEETVTPEDAEEEAEESQGEQHQNQEGQEAEESVEEAAASEETEEQPTEEVSQIELPLDEEEV